MHGQRRVCFCVHLCVIGCDTLFLWIGKNVIPTKLAKQRNKGPKKKPRVGGKGIVNDKKGKVVIKPKPEK